MRTLDLTDAEQMEANFLARRLLKAQGPSKFAYDCAHWSSQKKASRGQLDALRVAVKNLPEKPRAKRVMPPRSRIRQAQAVSLTARRKRLEAAA